MNRPRKLEPTEWHAYFDGVTKLLAGKHAFVVADSPALGDQEVAEDVPLLGISFDPKDNALEFAFKGLDHLVYNPKEIYVEEVGLGLQAVEVVDQEGVGQIATFKEPLALPGPV